jgi:hypothetical protein
VKIISIGRLIKRHILSIGFLNGNVEGHAGAIVRGAVETLLRDRPIFSFSSYHDFTEMYDISMFPTDLLPNHDFKWHIGRQLHPPSSRYLSWAGRTRFGTSHDTIISWLVNPRAASLIYTIVNKIALWLSRMLISLRCSSEFLNLRCQEPFAGQNPPSDSPVLSPSPFWLQAKNC